MQQQLTLSNNIFVPFLTRDRFCESVGISYDTLDGWVRRGYVQQIKIGKRSLIDLRPFLSGDKK